MGNEVGVFQWITIGLAIVTGLGMPVLIWSLTQARHERREKFSEMHGRLDHLDDCVDNVRDIVIGKAISREDFMSHRAEINESLTRMRAAISIESHALHERVMRLENRYFSGPPSPSGDGR